MKRLPSVPLHRWLLVPAAVLLLLLPPAVSALPLTDQVANEIRFLLASEGDAPAVRLEKEVGLNAELLPGFYRQRGHRPAWIDNLGFTGEARRLLVLLRSAADEGLCPGDYHLPYLDPLAELEEDYRRIGLLFDPRYMAEADLLLSDAFLLYATHMVAGRVDPEEVHQGWRARTRRIDLGRLLRFGLEEGRAAHLLADLAPPHPGYAALREALAEYRRLAALGGWPELAAGVTLRPGDRDGRIPVLAERLRLTGDLPDEGWRDDPLLFDEALEAAVFAFQRRHGLVADGVVGPRTREELNVPVERRILQLELNLERWRWLPKSLGSPHIAVNIADYSLQLFEEEEPILSMPVIVGTAYRRTPVFSGRMSYLEFSPYWTVPPTILREDKLPLIKRDPAWLEEHHFEIVTWDGAGTVDPASIDWQEIEAESFPGLLRMKPGPWNPLGRVKFMFPNRFAVYLHDTNDRYLFDRDERSFSSGCIRIAGPVELAEYLLEKQPEWSREAILKAMNRETPLQVPLERTVPVHILYWTGWVDPIDGTVQFRQDLYWRDLDLELALEKRWDGE